ncbi:hypothetical protein VNO78_13274 [Psophocarpus tetragonolobus]|uniref:Pectinesterase inhibitor domain-containing protein n=1 Tax=Psophocarpus tetragonolobus TaxID=3891 RepID=A0AAN9SQ72_PSOTE
MNMAFFMNMPREILLLFVLILSPALFTNEAKNFAAADYKLVETLCHNSETPETCLRCVNNAKGANNSDSVGIATIVVNCLNDKANELAVSMKKLGSQTQGPVKLICQRCAEDYGQHIAKEELASSKKALVNHKYDDAEFAVNKALSFDLACHSDLIQGSKVPTSVFNDMKIYEDLSEAAARIIEKL